MKLTRRLLLAAVAFSAALGTASIARAEDKLLYIDTKDGRITVKMRRYRAPNHVGRSERLAKEHFYANIAFHRVIDGFMAQGGDPDGTGMGSSRYPDLQAEFSSEP